MLGNVTCRRNSSCEYPPGTWKKLVKCPTLWAIFVGKCPIPCSYYDGQMPGLQSIWPMYKLFNLPFFNKHKCFTSIELHTKQVTKWGTPSEQRQSKWFYCFNRSFKVDKYSFIPKWHCLKPLLLTATEMTTGCYEASFLLFANAQGAGTLLSLLTAKCLAPRTHRAGNGSQVSMVLQYSVDVM